MILLFLLMIYSLLIIKTEIDMEKLDKKLQGINLAFAKKMFTPYENISTFAWFPYLIIILIGGFIVQALPQKWLGMALIGIGTIGVLFFKRYSNKTTFEIKPQLYKHKGVLSARQTGGGRVILISLFVDDYHLKLPDVLEHYGIDLANRHKGKSVEVILAVMNIKHKKSSQRVYTALRIGDNVCIENAIKQHGKYLFLKDSLNSIMVIVGFMVLVILLGLVAQFISNKIADLFGIVNLLADAVFGLLLLGAVVFSVWIVNKITPSDIT